jgi:hypothetical protein
MWRCRICKEEFRTKTGASVHATTRHAKDDVQRHEDLDKLARGEITRKEFNERNPIPTEEVL